MRKIVRLDPGSAVARNDLGAALFEAHRRDEAIAELREAARLDPNYVQPPFNLATILLEQGKTEEAITFFQQALRIKPEHATAHLRLGFALEQIGQLDDAIEHYRKTVQLDPKNAIGWWNLAESLSSRGKPGEAREAYRRVLGLQPENAEARERLSRLATQPAESRPVSAPQRRPPPPRALTATGVPQDRGDSLPFASVADGFVNELTRTCDSLGEGGMGKQFSCLAVATRGRATGKRVHLPMPPKTPAQNVTGPVGESWPDRSRRRRLRYPVRVLPA